MVVIFGRLYFFIFALAYWWFWVDCIACCWMLLEFIVGGIGIFSCALAVSWLCFVTLGTSHMVVIMAV